LTSVRGVWSRNSGGFLQVSLVLRHYSYLMPMKRRRIRKIFKIKKKAKRFQKQNPLFVKALNSSDQLRSYKTFLQLALSFLISNPKSNSNAIQLQPDPNVRSCSHFRSIDSKRNSNNSLSHFHQIL
jgi:hypothetical protein